ncbi:MAG: class I SAM-dependent methyltransferase [Acidimicrobiales bacterium]|nr:class I SAM-dependent methyltransferase [Acidimicrobiales bacterium]
MAWDRRTARTYDTVAADYDEQFRDELDSKPRDCELLDGLAVRASGVVLDIGSGPGHIGARIRAHGRPVLAVDVSLAMAAAAARRLDAAVVAEMAHLPVGAEAISDIVAFYSIVHLPRPRLADALREFARVLEPGGHALLSAHEGTEDVTVVEFLGHQVDLSATFFSLDELVAAALGAGFTVASAERRAPYGNEGPNNRLYLELEKR